MAAATQRPAKTARRAPSKPSVPAPRSDGCVLHVDAENYQDDLVGLLNAGVRWLGEPYVPGKFGTTEVTRGFAFAGCRALFAETTRRVQRAQIRLGKRHDAPREPRPCVTELVYRPVKKAPRRLSDWIIWQPLASDWKTCVAVELRASGSARSGQYSVDVVEGGDGAPRICPKVLQGLKQNRWCRLVLLRDRAVAMVSLWAGPPDREQFVGAFRDLCPARSVSFVRLGDDSSDAVVGSGYWDDVRIGGVLRRKKDLRPGEPSPILTFRRPKPTPPIPLTAARQLLVDDWVIDTARRVRRTLHPIRKHPDNPLVVPEHPWEGSAVLGGGGIFRDERTGTFRMFYKAYCPVHGPAPKYERQLKRSFTAMAESDDGIHWTKPNLGLFEFAGSRKNNIVIAAREAGAKEHELWEPWDIATGARAANTILYQQEEPDLERRYKAFVRLRGFSLLTSPDGVHWTDRGAVVSQAYDATTVAWDPLRQVYYGAAKVGAYGKRGRGYLESRDFSHWSDTRFQMTTDGRDLPADQMYAMDMWFYETVHLAFLKLYHVEPEHRLDIQLVSARDPRHWDRTFRTPIIPYGRRDSDEWDWANQSVLSVPPVRVGDELWIYYSGRTMDHKSRNCHHRRMPPAGKPWGFIGMGSLRLDGFVSADAGAAEGVLETKPLAPAGKNLWVNADAKAGSLRVEIADVRGRPLKGFEANQCMPITTDSVRREVRFRSGKSLPASDMPVRLRFHLKNASLYSFWTESAR